MKMFVSPSRQQGMTLIVGMVTLVLITLLVTSAFILSGTNLKSVGNMQFREEALAAANKGIEQMMSSGFATSPSSSVIDVDIDEDGDNDYVVNIATPTCVRGTQVAGTSGGAGSGSSVSLGFPTAPPPNFTTVWDIDATVTQAFSGASVRVRQGVRVLLTQAQYNAACL